MTLRHAEPPRSGNGNLARHGVSGKPPKQIRPRGTEEGCCAKKSLFQLFDDDFQAVQNLPQKLTFERAAFRDIPVVNRASRIKTKGHPVKVRLTQALRAGTTLTVAQIAARLQMGTRGYAIGANYEILPFIRFMRFSLFC